MPRLTLVLGQIEPGNVGKKAKKSMKMEASEDRKRLTPTPFTLHPTPYTLNPAHYTLHPTPYTLHQVLDLESAIAEMLAREEAERATDEVDTRLLPIAHVWLTIVLLLMCA